MGQAADAATIAKISAAQIEANAYADGEVSAEEARAIAEAAEKYTAAVEAARLATEAWSAEGATVNKPDSEAEAYVDAINPMMLDWAGFMSVEVNGHLDKASEWVFDSTSSGGGMIEIEVGDGFTGTIHVDLNGTILTMESFGDRNFGDVTQSSDEGFSDENNIINFNDFSAGDKSYDLGGLT